MIKILKIFPPIGVARLGKSPDEYFIGPEQPNQVAAPAGGFRDATGLIKRQAARFRLFAFDEHGALVKEITATDADSIAWTVHVANSKAAADAFDMKSNTTPKKRNESFQDRQQLTLDPGPVTVSGTNPNFADLAQSRNTGHAKEFLVNQQFLDHPVQLTLGTATTDDEGRLLVLGGHGESKSPTGAPLDDSGNNNFANHDGWYDDVSDGVVSAAVQLKDGSMPPVVSAWVVVAPPKYAPGLQSIVTLYDTLLQMAVDRHLMPDPLADATFKPSLAADIIPILMRAANMRWVYAAGSAAFDANHFHHTFNTMPLAGRQAVFNRLSVPSATPGNPGTGTGNMPKMWSDLYGLGRNGTLTQTQYKMMKMWKDGNFDAASVLVATAVTPEGLTKAALLPCVGGAFFPGIEVSWKIRDVFPFIEPFRVDPAHMRPGDISSQMSLPWQTDFLDCAVEPSSVAGANLVWWPAQRPIDVLKAGSNAYIPWARTSNTGTGLMSPEEMVTAWNTLGLILEANNRFEETRS